MQILIRRRGGLIRVEFAGSTALDITKILSIEITSQLVFEKSVQTYGFNGRRELGIQPYRLYEFDNDGSIVCPVGFTSRITRIAKDMGYDVRYVDETVYPRDIADRLKCTPAYPEQRIVFRAGQKESLDAIIGLDRGIIKAPTGSGKTITMIAAAFAFLNAKIAIVEPDVTNLHRAAREFSGYFGTVGTVGDSKRRFDRITIGTIHSAHHLLDFDYDILFVDEVHLMLADKMVGSLSTLVTRAKSFAFDATPTGRSDRADIRAESLFGEIVYEIHDDTAIESGAVLPCEIHWYELANCPVVITDNLNDVAVNKKALWTNRARNELIAQIARSLPIEEQTLITVKTVEHAVNISELLPHYEVVFSAYDKAKMDKYLRQGFLSPNTVVSYGADRDEAERRFKDGSLKHVIATGWETGADFPQLQHLIRANSFSASKTGDKQAAGRPRRSCPSIGKTVGKVHEIYDSWDSRMAGRCVGRFRLYNQLGFRQFGDLPLSIQSRNRFLTKQGAA